MRTRVLVYARLQARGDHRCLHARARVCEAATYSTFKLAIGAQRCYGLSLEHSLRDNVSNATVITVNNNLPTKLIQ